MSSRRYHVILNPKAGTVVALGLTSEKLAERMIAIASGESTAAERNGEREMAIWKRGVTL
jgi:altronate hydrolase